MEVVFYCEDARNPFLDPESIDLFITHPPFLNEVPEAYGGDLTLQIQNAANVEDYSNSLIRSIQSMSLALKDSGAILLILPNSHVSFKIIRDIIDQTSLIINRDIIWNFEKSDFVKSASGNEINHILYITKNKEAKHNLKELYSFVINENWSFFALKNSKFDSLPKNLVNILIRSFSNEGETVADLMAGTGTVAICSIENNRKAVYNDVSTLQSDLAKSRVYDTIEDNRKGL